MQRKQLAQPRTTINVEEFVTTKQLKLFTPRAKKNSQQNKVFEATFSLVKNNHKRQCFRKLIEFKCIISQQLPKMPRDYIVKLLFDTKHQSLLAHHPQDPRIIAGICFRCFQGKDFAEVVFLAVENQFRERKIGTQLIDSLKERMQQRGVKLLLTYADNTALGFFRKQGFEAVIETASCPWNGYIKSYLEGTLMECKIFDKLKYTRFKSILQQHRKALISKIKSTPAFKYSSATIQFIKQKYKQEFLTVEKIPGVYQSRWCSKQQEELQEQTQYSVILQQLYAVQSLRKCPQANIFRGLTHLHFKNSSALTQLDNWSSIQKKIINCRNYESMEAVCKAISDMLLSYYNSMEQMSKERPLIKQLQRKSLPILTALQERRLAIYVEPIFKDKETRPRKSQLQRHKDMRKK